MSTLVDFPIVTAACESGVGSKNSAATSGRVFYWGHFKILNRALGKEAGP
jgi:hypothetical protein